jgi:hypothetical protein
MSCDIKEREEDAHGYLTTDGAGIAEKTRAKGEVGNAQAADV